MSLSNPDNTPDNKGKWSGKVILGPAGLGRSEVTISEIEGSKTHAWNEATESEYLQRVSSKAAQRAQKMIDTAHQQAEEIKRQAYQEAYNSGMEKAREEAEGHIEQMTAQFGDILSQIEAGVQTLWDQQREDLVSLVQLSVEKITALELSENRVKSIYMLLDEALERLESQRDVKVRLNPDDAKLISELLKRLKGRHPRLERWRITPDQSLDPGGVVMESEFGMVDNSMATRRQRIQEILDQLSL